MCFCVCCFIRVLPILSFCHSFIHYYLYLFSCYCKELNVVSSSPTIKVSSLLGSLKDDLLQVQQVHQLKGFAGSAKSLEGPSSKSFILMAQLKLFVDLPTKVRTYTWLNQSSVFALLAA